MNERSIDLSSNLKIIRENIADAERRFHRQPHSVKLLLVSKHQSVQIIEEAISNGQTMFGENYCQEALSKITALRNCKINLTAPSDIEWHFIGAIQSNKTCLIAENFTWVHTLSQLKIAERLNAQRPDHLPPINICIQVNIDAQDSKNGISVDAILPFAEKLVLFPRLKLRGLMSLPQPRSDFNEQRLSFRRISDAFKKLQQEGFAVDTLSMGTSDDYSAAIAEGATIVRLGRSVFGERVSRNVGWAE
jgi:pyridoxal phosphate enzyme (YggS family)